MAGITLKDIAREANVSIASASRAINGLDNVADDVKQRVLEIAKRLRYVPHGGARSLVMSRTHTIGVLLPDIYGEFFAEIIRGIDVAARARGLHLLLSGSHDGNPDEALRVMRTMGGRVDGLLVMSPFVDSHDLASALPLNLPVVTIASRIGADQRSISVDNFGGGVTAANHLREQGCRRLAHISGPSRNFEAQERKRGFLSTFSSQRPPLYEGDFTEESGYHGAKTLLALDERPDGIFAANDMMAVGCLLALREAGVNVPVDVAVVGFDDIPIARFTSPPLTTLRVGIFDLGRRGLEMLMVALEAGEHTASEGIIMVPELVMRDSSRHK